MDTTPDTPAAVEELARLAKTVVQELDRAVAAQLDGMTVAQWHVLSALEGGQGKAMSALGVATLLPGPSLTRLIDGMVEDNLVLRKVDVTDRRRVLVFQTRRGAAAHQRARARLAKSEDLTALVTRNAGVAELLGDILAQMRGQDLAPTSAPA
ncbi:putative MarR family transcriptional regulator [Mycolicibacterium canariasense]|uniref:Putative MarR family transcriptional regulator n=1 Tax=Mycolicibacterium canariasense TaxID=228230 RepID=A0A100WK16_MYCCR|nr:MarR family transcriptional regulator [Mycolicibacterium canariasense]MCV7207203.1 MarR family transcriptional regulator [Mycolicibacterium canariasense]ORV06560.1 MarR family transcriptional regulator [Mycolicibacterium canariasense]GAS99541.1 putative MarR family transcriptional regulator [Mycolicibacterium canariasense]